MPDHVYVLFGIYADRSDAKILGVYTTIEAAQDRLNITRSADSVYRCNYIKMPLDRAAPVRLEP